MSGLSSEDRDDLWSGLRRARHEDAPIPLAQDHHKTHVLWAVTPAVEQIVARRVAEALTEAADAIEAAQGPGHRAIHDVPDDLPTHYEHAARIVRSHIPKDAR